MEELAEFYSIQAPLADHVRGLPRRFLYQALAQGPRLQGVIGARGTGKTTLILQQIPSEGDRSRVDAWLYISVDHVRAQAAGLYNLGASFFRLGGTSLLLDEIHKYPKWRQETKNLYDSFPDNRIVFSGSSTLALQESKGDLSRRAVYHTLPGLSFREFLLLQDNREYPSMTLREILDNHQVAAERVRRPILDRFQDYLKRGAYPFFLEGTAEYPGRLMNVVDKALYDDLAVVLGVRPTNVPVIKRMLWLIATSQPFIPNIEKMSRELSLSKEYVYLYLDGLEKAGIITFLFAPQRGYRLVRKPAKVYMDNTNLLRVIAGDIGFRALQGTVRETFFLQQVRGAGLSVHADSAGDFVVNGRHILEVGGRKKTAKQLRDLDAAYVVRDDIEVGFGRVIPLWLFGFLY